VIAAFATSLLGLGTLSQVVAAPEAAAAGAPATLPMQGADPNWTRITNMKAIWAPALNPDGTPMADPTNGGMGPLNSNSVYWTSDSSSSPTGLNGTNWILGESYNFNADATSYQTRSVMTVQRTATGGGSFTGTALDTQAIAPIGGTYGEATSGTNVPLTIYMWNDAGSPQGLNGFGMTCPANYIYVMRVTSGESDMYVGCMPEGGAIHPWMANPPLGNTFAYGTGGEADQYSGYLFVQPMYGTLDDCGWNSVASCVNGSNQQYFIWDPVTGKYVQSGPVVPADFSATTTTTISQVRNRARATSASVNANPSGAASGSAWVNGGASDITADFGLAANGDLFTYAGVAMPTSGVSNISLLRISPSKDASGNYTVPTAANPWTYSVTTKLTKTPTGAGTDSWPTGSAMWGTGIHNGIFLVTAISGGAAGPAVQPPTTGVNASASLMLRVDPLTGATKLINSSSNGTVQVNSSGTGTGTTMTPATTTNMRDAASPQQLSVIEGYVFNDVNGKGDPSDSGFTGVGGVPLALYNSSNVMVGQVSTDSTGAFSFITSGTGTFTVRVVQPQINGVNAVQTWAGGYTGTSLAGGPINSTTVQCRNVPGGVSTGAGEATTLPTGQACNGALAAPYVDATPTMGSTANPSTFPIYATVDLHTDQDVAYVDFGVTTMGSYGDSTAGPDTVANKAPVHANGLDSPVWFGQVLGNYAAPAMNSTAHNATFNSDGTTASGSDDGIYIGGSSLVGNVPVATAIVLAATRPYTLKGTVSGTQANDPSTYAAGWTTPAGSITLNQTPAWAPTISSGVASGPFTATTSVASGVVQLRTQVSTGLSQAITHPDNGANEYQAQPTSTTQLWTTPGEIEDYAFQVAPSVYRPAVETIGPSITGPVAVTPTTPTTAINGVQQNFSNITSTPQVGSGVGIASGTSPSLTIAVPTGYTVSAQVVDTETGAPMYTAPTVTNPSGPTATVTWGPMATNDDVTVILTLALPADNTQSSMSCTPAGPLTADGTQAYTCTALVKNGAPLANQTVDFWADASSPLVLSSDTCTTGTDGQCMVGVQVTSEEAGTWNIHASVDTTGAKGSVPDPNWKEVSNSPVSLVFDPGIVTDKFCDIVDHGTTYRVQSKQVYPYPFTTVNSTATPPTPPTPDTVAPTGTNTLTDTDTQEVRVYLFDDKCNAVPGDTVVFSGTGSESGTPTVTTTQGTTDAFGMASGTFADTTTEVVTAGGTYTAPGTPPTDSGDLKPATLTFTSGPVCSDPSDPKCHCTVTAMPENISATIVPGQVYSGDAPWNTDGTSTNGSSTVTADGTSTVLLRTWLLDSNCQKVDNATATFTGTPVNTPATSTITPTTAVPVDDNGLASAHITDTKAETVTTGGTYANTVSTDHGDLASTTASFTADQIATGTQCGSYIVGQVYASPLSVVTTSTTPTSNLTVLLADSHCNPIQGAEVTLTANATPPAVTTPSSTFTGNPATTGADGFAHAVISDTHAEVVTIRGSYDGSHGTSNGVTKDYGSGNLWPSADTPPTDVVTFKEGGIDPNVKCVVTVDNVDYTVQSHQVYPYPFVQDSASTDDPKAPLKTASPTVGSNQAVRTYLFDAQCNPEPGYTVSFAGDPATQPDGAQTTTTTLGTTGSDGMATGSVVDKKAQTVNVGGSYTNAATPPDAGSLLSAAVTFMAGNPATCMAAGSCTCVDSTDTATNLTVSQTTAGVTGGTILATAHVTDSYCNVVANGTTVNFSVSPTAGQTAPAGTGTPFVGSGTTAGTTSTVAVTTTNGNATATVSDTTAEKVDVAATITVAAAPAAIYGSPKTVEFTAGIQSSKESTLTCTATSTATPPTTPMVSADGSTDYWTCVMAMKDEQRNPLPSLDVTKFTFTQLTNTATATTVVNSGGGNYTVKFWSTEADSTNTVKASYDGTWIDSSDGTQANAKAAPIPFIGGPPCDPTKETCGPCDVNGMQYVPEQVYANPNSVKTALPGATTPTSTLTVLLADKFCNPIEGGKVTYTQGTGTSASFVTTQPVLTNVDGLATNTVFDHAAETVTFGGSFDATAAKSAGMPGNFGTGSLKSDTTTSVVEFTAGDVQIDTPCDVVVMPENVPATILVGHVYSGSPPWNTDGTSVGGSSSVTANGTSTVALRTWLLDANCDKVQGATATFIGNPATPSVIAPATAIPTDSNGMAAATIKDTKAETVNTGGTYGNTISTDHGNLVSTTATFNQGAIDPGKSSFVVAPAVDPTSTAKTGWVVADGTSNYTGYVAAYDANGNPVTNLNATDFVYTVTGVPNDPIATTQPSVKVTIGSRVGNRYNVSFTTTYAAATYTVTAALASTPSDKITGTTTDGATVTTWANGVAVPAGTGGTPIPFQAGTPVGGTDTPVKCTADGRNQSWISVSSPSQAAGTPATVTVHLTDVNCNPVTNALVSFTPSGNARMSAPTATTDAQGVVTSNVNDYTAETVQVRASNGPAVVGPVTTVFTAGAPSVTPDCTLNATYTQGTVLKVAATSIQLRGSTPGTTPVDAYVTDQYCNPVTFDTSVSGAHGVDVTFAVAPIAPATSDSAYFNGTATSKTYTMQTDSTGHATTTLSGTAAETVNVKAQLSATAPIRPTDGINVTFATGDFDGTQSSFRCVVTTGSSTPPTANGTDSYTCTIDAKDSAYAALPLLDTNGFVFAVTAGTPAASTNQVDKTSVTNNGDGTYTVKFSTLFADDTYNVKASYAGEQITGTTSLGATTVPTPIPFKAGPPVPYDPINPMCGSREKTNTKIDPKTPSPVAGTAVNVTTLVTDKDCNPIPGASVAWTVTSNSNTAALDQPSKTTGTDGKAATKLNDDVAEYVQVAAKASGSGVTDINAGSDSVTFVAGTPDLGPIDPCPAPGMTGSNLSATSPVATAGTSAVTARVTDSHCNLVTTPVTVTFAITSPSTTASIYTTPGSQAAQTVNGIATASATDNIAETAKVTATIPGGALYAPKGSTSDSPRAYTQAPIVFQAGVADPARSTFTCAVTPGSATPPVADGTQSYTCTITLHDSNGNGLTTTDPTHPASLASFDFAKSDRIDASAITEVNPTSAPGEYRVTFTTMKSDPNYTVTVSYDGGTITGPPTVVPTPIPFQSGAPVDADKDKPVCVTGPNAGSPRTYTQAAPTSTQVGTTYSSSVGSLITTYVTDDNCNPVVGATVTFSQDKSATFTQTAAGSYTTNASGNATAYELDTTAETTHVTSTVGYRDPTSGANKVTAGDDGTINVTFTAGTEVDEVPGVCPDGSSGHVNGTNLKTTSPQMVSTDSTTTAYITDAYCNPKGGVPVTFSVTPTATASLTGSATVATGAVPVSGPTPDSGKAVTTFTDTKNEVAAIIAKIQINGVATAIYAAPPTDTGITGWTSTTSAPSRFTVGGPGTKLCQVTVGSVTYSVSTGQVYPFPFVVDTASTATPKEPLKTAPADPATPLKAGTTQGLRTYMFDDNCNPLPGYTVAFTDGTPAGAGAALRYSTTQGTTDSDGMASGTVYDELAETVHPAGTYHSAETPPQYADNLKPAAVTYTAGDQHDGPDYSCGTKPGTHLTADHVSTTVNTYTIVEAYVTDEYCNPIDGALVNFAFTGSPIVSTDPEPTHPLFVNPAGQPTPVKSTTARFTTSNTAVATVGGYAHVTVTDTTAETINVRATDEYIGDVQMTFTPGDVDRTKTAFECVAHSTATGAPIDNNNSTGGDYYTCTITAKDSFGNVLTDTTSAGYPAATDFAITIAAPSGGSVTATAPVAGATAGTFTSTLTSKIAGSDYTATATFQGSPVGPTGTPTVVPVPFQTGPVSVGTICDVGGQQVMVGQIYAYTPGTTALLKAAVVKSGVTEGLKVFMADADCNPIPGVNVTITPTPAGSVALTMGINPTGTDGWATATATDTKPDTVRFNGTYSSTANGSGDLFAADVTWDPPTPVITGPTGTVVTDDPIITGTGSKEGDTITVTDGSGNTYCTATVQADLTWSCKPAPGTKLPHSGTRGTPAVTATESDAAGNSSDPSAAKTVTIDTTPATISGPADGSTVVSDTPEISGGPGSAPYGPTTVEITTPDPNDPTKTITVCTATVKPDGSWSCKPTTPLPPGDDVLTPVVHDADGGSSDGTPVLVKVNKAAPAITSPKANTTVIVSKPPIKGTAPYSPAPNPTVVTVTDGNGNVVCTATVKSDGTWSCTPTKDLPNGSTSLTATVKDANGNSQASTIKLTVNATAPMIDPIAAGTNQQPSITGKGAGAGDQITVKDSDGSTLCTATVAANLTWSCTPTKALGFGNHTLTATETDKSGDTRQSAPVTIAINAIVVQTGGLSAAATGLSGTAAAGGSGLAGVWVAIAAIRRRETAEGMDD